MNSDGYNCTEEGKKIIIRKTVIIQPNEREVCLFFTCYHLKKILIRSFNRKNISFSFIVVMAYHEKSKFSDSFSHKMFYLALTLM